MMEDLNDIPQQDIDMIMNYINQLSSIQRRVIVMYINDMDVDVIAYILEMDSSIVQSYIDTALEDLKSLLELSNIELLSYLKRVLDVYENHIPVNDNIHSNLKDYISDDTLKYMEVRKKDKKKDSVGEKAFKFIRDIAIMCIAMLLIHSLITPKDNKTPLEEMKEIYETMYLDEINYFNYRIAQEKIQKIYDKK